MSSILRALTHIAVLTIIFALATYTALTIQPYVSNSTTFNETLGPESPLIIGGYGLYVNPTAIITNAVLVAIAYSLLARGKPKAGLVRYSLGMDCRLRTVSCSPLPSSYCEPSPRLHPQCLPTSTA